MEVVQGQHPESSVWRKLQGLKALTPASALHRSRGVSGDVKSSVPGAGASSFLPVEAIRTAEEGSMDRLLSCRSLALKGIVLDTALDMSNHDAILLVIFWMRDTLKKDLFNQEICVRPKAVSVYASYLRDMHRWEELEAFYTTMRALEVQLSRVRPQPLRTDTCAQLAYCMVRRALSRTTPDDLVAVLKEAGEAAAALAQASPELEAIAEHCACWRQLVLRQVDMEKADAPVAQAAAGLPPDKTDPSNMFARFPRPCVLAASVLETINYAALFHAADRQDHYASPKSLVKALGVSDKLYWFCVFTALARSGSWDLMRKATESKSTFSNKVNDPPHLSATCSSGPALEKN